MIIQLCLLKNGHEANSQFAGSGPHSSSSYYYYYYYLYYYNYYYYNFVSVLFSILRNFSLSLQNFWCFIFSFPIVPKPQTLLDKLLWLCNRIQEKGQNTKTGIKILIGKTITQEKNMMWKKKTSKIRDPNSQIIINRGIQYC